MFLDISKVFDKVWHESLINNLKQNGRSGKMLKDLLRNRKQREVRYGQFSSWVYVKVCVP